MPFHIYCTCGPGGTMKKVKADRKNHVPLVSWFGRASTIDMRKAPVPVNQCRECGKVWPALPARATRAPHGQMSFQLME